MDSCELQNFQLALACGSYHLYDVADAFSHETLPDRRGGRDLPEGNVGFFAGDQRVFDLLVLRIVENLDDRAERYAIFGNVAQVHQRQVAHAFFELAEARVHELLALLSHVVLSVLAQVAERCGLLDFLWKLVGKLMLQSLNFFQQFLLYVFRHGPRRSIRARATRWGSGIRTI